MSDTRPKHKPNEKHTLDEVLKSLKDLVRNEVLDKAKPSPAATPAAEPAPSMANVGDIIHSLEDLLEGDLSLEDKSAPKAPHPETIEITAAEELVISDDMSDEDLAKFLENLDFETTAAPAPDEQPAVEPETIEAAPAPELKPTLELAKAAPARETAPALELTIQEPAAETPEISQHELNLSAPALRAIELPAENGGAMPLDTEITLDVVDDDDISAPTPAETSLANELAEIDFDLDSAPAQDAPKEMEDEIDLEDPAPPAANDEFSVDFAPAQKTAESPTMSEELAPPPWSDDHEIERAEPPIPAGDIPTGSLGEAVEFDVAPTEIVESAPATEVLEAPFEALEEESNNIDLAVVIEAAAAAPPPPKEIPVLKDVALAPPAKPIPPPAKPAPSPAHESSPPPPTPAPALDPDSFKLEPSPPMPPPAAPPSHDLNQLTVRVIAKLNIELRKASKPGLDVKTINRLQQLLREALDKK